MKWCLCLYKDEHMIRVRHFARMQAGGAWLRVPFGASKRAPTGGTGFYSAIGPSEGYRNVSPMEPSLVM